MMETLFGSAPPMWTGIPPMVLAAQSPFAPASRGVATSMFGSPILPGGSGPSTPTFASPFAFGPQPGSAFANPEMMGVTAPALVAAVAMRRGQLQAPTNDQEIEDFIYDAIDLLVGTADVEVRCENGRATLTGSVQHKRVKRDVGEIAWAIPGVNDVQNNVAITSRRRARTASRDIEPATAGVAGRKQG